MAFFKNSISLKLMSKFKPYRDTSRLSFPQNTPFRHPFSNQSKTPNGFFNRFATEICRIFKEDLLNIRSFRKTGKTYSKIDPEVLKKQKLQREAERNTTVTAIQEVKEKLSLWQKIFGRAKETKIYDKYKGYGIQFKRYAKNNPNFKKFETLRESISDRVEDIKEAYETTQNPLVWKVRDLGDRMFAENETAFSLRKVGEVEPDFSPYDFNNELKMHILPVIVQALIGCDLEFAKQTCIDNAYKTAFSYSKAVEQSEVSIKCQLIDIIETDFIGATIHNKKPVLNFSCIGQHLETVTSKKPKKGETPTYFMKNVFYKLTLTPDRECPVFGWKFVDIQMQQMYALKSE